MDSVWLLVLTVIFRVLVIWNPSTSGKDQHKNSSNSMSHSSGMYTPKSDPNWPKRLSHAPQFPTLRSDQESSSIHERQKNKAKKTKWRGPEADPLTLDWK